MIIEPTPEIRCLITEPIPVLLWCPICNNRHIDTGEFETKLHHTHACQFCGHVWRPAIVNTVGVQFLPGFKNDTNESDWVRQIQKDMTNRFNLTERLSRIDGTRCVESDFPAPNDSLDPPQDVI